jgi:hypothetical protein
MTDWLCFEGRIEAVVWGRASYTLMRLPPDVADALLDAGAKRVEGEMNEHPVNLALTRAPVVEDVFLWTGQSLLERIGVAPGDVLEVRLRPVPDDRVDLPGDLALALAEAGVADRWEALTPGRRRGMLYKLDTARTASTRAKRIAALVAGLDEEPVGGLAR